MNSTGLISFEDIFPPGSLVKYWALFNNLLHQMLSTYISLLPEIFGCVSLVLGCQLCFFQTYFVDLGSSPVGCLAGCAGSVAGSCGQIVANSISIVARRLMEQHPEPNLD